ncbi:MAG: hypothetical protein ACRECL_19560 [Bradyrhizobium sp.]
MAGILVLRPTLRRRIQREVNPKPKMRSIGPKSVRMVNGVLKTGWRGQDAGRNFSPAATGYSSSLREIVIDGPFGPDAAHVALPVFGMSYH